LLTHWEDKTIRRKDPFLEKRATKHNILNGEATNISKDLVDLAHHKAFGYATVVDPNTYHGKCVKKSNENAAHDGVVVECPVQHHEKGVIYQKLINNLTEDGYAEDIRVPVIGDEIPHVYLKYKPLDSRFANFRETEKDKPTQIKKTHDILSDSEIHSILHLAKAMHLDFGEMDALRNRDDGKLYVVDVNNTPTGPSHLEKKELRLAISNLSASFKKQFL
jgi:glutathione synthase/RimK-type ligase-like ATP-grasp enzyme